MTEISGIKYRVTSEGIPQAQRELSGLDSTFRRAATAATAFVGAYLGLRTISAGIDFMQRATRAAAEQEKAERLLTQTLINRGQHSAAYVAQLGDIASRLQRVTTVGDETILGVERQLIAFGASANQIEQLTETVLDLSQGLKGGGGLEGAVLLVGKALQGEFSTLSRYGILVNKAGTDAEKMADAQRQIAILFGGQARAAAQTYEGALARLSNAWGDVQEGIGDFLVRSPLVRSTINELTDTVYKWSDGLRAARDGQTQAQVDSFLGYLRNVGRSVDTFVITPLITANRLLNQFADYVGFLQVGSGGINSGIVTEGARRRILAGETAGGAPGLIPRPGPQSDFWLPGPLDQENEDAARALQLEETRNRLRRDAIALSEAARRGEEAGANATRAAADAAKEAAARQRELRDAEFARVQALQDQASALTLTLDPFARYLDAMSRLQAMQPFLDADIFAREQARIRSEFEQTRGVVLRAGESYESLQARVAAVNELALTDTDRLARQLAEIATLHERGLVDATRAGLARRNAITQATSAANEELAQLERIENAVNNVGRSFEDALVRGIRAGRLEWNDFVNSFLDDLTRLAVQESITRPVFGAIVGLMRGNGSPRDRPPVDVEAATASADRLTRLAAQGFTQDEAERINASFTDAASNVEKGWLGSSDRVGAAFEGAADRIGQVWGAVGTTVGSLWTSAMTGFFFGSKGGGFNWGDFGFSVLGGAISGLTRGLVNAKWGGGDTGIPQTEQLAMNARDFDQRFTGPGTQDIPRLEHGGIVPGPIGAPRLAIVHGGEEFSGVGRHLPRNTTPATPQTVMNVTAPLEIRVTSLDPRTAAAVITEQMPMIEAHIRKSINRGGALARDVGRRQ